MAIDPGTSRSKIWHRVVLAVGFIMVAWFYAWTNGPTAASWKIGGEQTDYYSVLMHGFLKGHLYMDTPVAEELKNCPNPWDPAVRGPNCPILQDATYYNGRYYLYYGVAPLTLMLPFRLITGADMPLSMATVCLASAGLLFGLILWESIRERHFPGIRAWVGLAAVLILGVASPMPVLLRRTLVYELPIASGACFGMAALLSLYWSIHSQRSRIAWLVVASIAMGLAVASRLTYLFAIPILLIPVWTTWREQGRRSFSKLSFQALAAAVLPIASIGALMALYNYQRFGHLAEFGTKYQVAEMFNLMNPRRFAAAYVPFNLVDYSLATPDLSRHFPYFYFPGAWHWSINAPEGYWGPELVPGVLVCFPICWLAALSILTGLQTPDPQRGRLRAWLLCPGCLFAATGVCLLCYYAGAVRYMVDFTPYLMLCTSLGLLVLEDWLVRRRTVAARVIGRGAWLGLLAVSSLVAVMFSLGARATFRAVDPVGHARVAKFFEDLSFWNPRLPNQPGPVEIDFRIDRIGLRESQPLFACGAGDDSEHVFLRRTDDEHVVIGYRRGLSAPPQLSSPIGVKAGDVHRLYLDLGSLYSATPAGITKEANSALPFREKLNRRWVILFDDDIVLRGNYSEDQHPAAGTLVFLGCDPNSDDFGKVLLSPIVSVQRLSLPEAAARANNRSSMGLEFKAPRDVTHGSQTLLGVVDSGADFRAEIEYLGEGQAALQFWSDGHKFEPNHHLSNNGQWHRLELDQIFTDGRNTLHVRLDGIALATMPGGRLDLRRAALRPGWGKPSIAAFTGLVRNAASDSVQPPQRPPRGPRIALSVIFPRHSNDSSEPLLVTGRTDAGDLYEVVYLDQDHVCFRQDHWGTGIVRTSRPFKTNPDVPHRIVFECQPKPGGAQRAGLISGVMRMTIDGQQVWDKDAPSNPFNPDEVYIGLNDLGGSTCAREFSGEIISCDTNAGADRSASGEP